MCPEKNYTRLDHQRGFLMPVALFIIVIMGIYALVLWRTTSQSNLAAVQEVISVQAFYAAESGAQRGMAALFFPEVSRKQTDMNCQGMARTMPFTAVTGLNNCQAVVSCTCAYNDGNPCDPSEDDNYSTTAPVIRSFYTVQSIGSCGSGNISAVRTLEVQATMEQEGL